jgi:hypothetical protein
MNAPLYRSLVVVACVTLAVTTYQRAVAADRSLPTLLSETGIAQGPLPFSPQYPLWTDGATKRRWVYLPEGATIDASDPNRWVYPDGTKFWKEFSFGGRKVETRLLWKRDGEWVFAAYVWNDAQTDATLVPPVGMVSSVEVAPGRPHRIPSTADCRACHVSSRVEVLGFNALQLSPDRDPNALHAESLTSDMVTLSTLLESRQLSHAPDEWRTTPPRIAVADPDTRSVLGYLAANCAHCHNRDSDLRNLDFDLSVEPKATPCAAALATTVDRPGRWVIPTAPDMSRRVAPSKPELSAIVARMHSRRPSTQMPPLGTSVVDVEAVALLSRWIAADAATWRHRMQDCRLQ